MLAVPAPDVLAAFTLACGVLIVTPGPDMALFLSRTVAQGRLAGLATLAGALSGILVHSALAALGLSALLAASPAAFDVLKFAGAAYLVWLAFQALRHRGGLTLEPAPARLSTARLYASGLGVNLLNPKVILFFVTFLPQFVAADDPAAAGRLGFLGLYFIALAAPSCTLMVLAADRIAGWLRASPAVMRTIDYLFAGVMGAFALKLITARTVGS
ncbi:LysE family translocator [Blastochloris viridis]|uniref:Amino acid efflux protein n=1 Tax=Blastochloris viridis TaxID=1079 RepID=A0A0H5BP98_BLAVI|nr:LysE family translocator [Blastochloris viridis]ALK11054.1 Homoserine/homoserine lactone efflux protein [Blastochloris viridis]BAR98958.1 amino acid efflux protein [Blastochloris viridis]CUU43716.1 Homoserine/homoserine lactone efflux protein [Blastochloris viridis]